MTNLKWCFSIKGGLKLVEPNKNISDSYLSEAENTLSRIKFLIDEGDFIWASVRIYYCAYYSLYSFLQKIGVKCENHDCSISLVDYFLGEEVKDIFEFKKNRIDSQYYLKVGRIENLGDLYFKCKNFYLYFKDLIDGIEEKDIVSYRKKIKLILKEEFCK